MREADITVEYLTKKLRAYSKEDIISALVKTDFITADRVAGYCEDKKLMREAEADRYKALVKELKQGWKR